jgi:hypothetical protein
MLIFFNAIYMKKQYLDLFQAIIGQNTFIKQTVF